MSVLHIYKSRLLLVNLDQNLQVKKVYRLLKGDYFKDEQFSLVKVDTPSPRFLQIGYSKKYKIREILKLRITNVRDEHNLEELVGEMKVVGKLKSSRLNFNFAVRQNEVYIVGGLDEYRRAFTKQIEVIRATNDKGTPLEISQDFPDLKIGRTCPSCLIVDQKYLYVMFGKSKKGRGEIF